MVVEQGVQRFERMDGSESCDDDERLHAYSVGLTSLDPKLLLKPVFTCFLPAFLKNRPGFRKAEASRRRRPCTDECNKLWDTV